MPKLLILCLMFISVIPGCADRLSSTYPKMKATVTDHGFTEQEQVPAPTNLGPTAPWYGIASKNSVEYIVVIYPTMNQMYTVTLGENRRKTNEQMIAGLTAKGYKDVARRLRLKAEPSTDEHRIAFYWAYYNEKGEYVLDYFDLQGEPMDIMRSYPDTFSFPSS